jgi:hypothetical protein
MNTADLNKFRDHLAQHHHAKFEFLLSSEEDLLEWHKRDHSVFTFPHKEEQLPAFK